jgi:hypothetical protein
MGTLVVSLNTVTRAAHIQLLARQIHYARILPTTPPVAPLAFTALSPLQPCSSQPHRSLRDDGDEDAVTGM